jgi:putative component of toxin-antitoxin plasmid stabilization module
VLRIRRIAETGNYGDCGPAGEGVFELRIGGDKSTQQSGIRKAKAYWRDYNA